VGDVQPKERVNRNDVGGIAQKGEKKNVLSKRKKNTHSVSRGKPGRADAGKTKTCQVHVMRRGLNGGGLSLRVK